MPNLISKTATIQAPVERVFDLLVDPGHLSKVNPDITITSHSAAAVGGFDMDWEYRFGALTLNGQSTVVEFDRPSRLIIDTSGGIPSRWMWSLCECEQGTALSLELEYTVPKQLAFLGKLLERQNERSVETQIANLTLLAERP
jgi:hypothetical protein